MKREPGILKTLIHNPALSIAVIFIIGLVLSPSGADVAALKRGTVDIASSGKLSRIITVGLAGLLTLGVFMSNPANRIKAMFTGNLRY
ncbi:MAG TPA: hypothetical protein EYO59_00495, partial [Chromatiaceae bacterium]|nr:hypothetical protein [Chromatiaceae bacterium]